MAKALKEQLSLKEDCTPKEEIVSKPYDPRDETRLLFNNPELSDVRLIVDGQTVYGHKFVLAMGSPVFDRLFFGELKVERDVIEIQDVTKPGFMNALRYIYGFGIDFDIDELCECYVAADKYLLHGFSKAIFDFVKANLDKSCQIYGQLAKIGEREQTSLDIVKFRITKETPVAFQGKCFMEIGQESLIGLLSLDELNIPEIDLLAAVSKWIDYQVLKQGLPLNRENRRKVFEPIKAYIVFIALRPETILGSKLIDKLLTEEEKMTAFSHQLNNDNPPITELKTPRMPACHVPCTVSSALRFELRRPFSSSVNLTVNRKVSIQTIHTNYSVDAANVNLKIFDSKGVDLSLEIKSSVQDDRVTGECQTKDDHLNEELKLKSQCFLVFDLRPCPPSNPQFVCGLDFLASD